MVNEAVEFTFVRGVGEDGWAGSVVHGSYPTISVVGSTWVRLVVSATATVPYDDHLFVAAPDGSLRAELDMTPDAARRLAQDLLAKADRAEQLHESARAAVPA
jgi:hypothetical protein